MRWLVPAVGLLAGCDRLLGITPVGGDGAVTSDGSGGGGDDGGGGGGGDADASPGQECIGGAIYFNICYPSATVFPTLNYTGTTTFDTNNDASCMLAMHDGREVCIVLASNITIIGTLRARGNRPLVLASTSDVTINSTGVLDVSSRTLAAEKGAGGNDASCTRHDGGAQPFGQNHSGGGAGGSFGFAGGTGGAGQGTVAVADAPTGAPFLRGGCQGGNGGKSYFGNVVAKGGNSGGAVYVIAKGSINLDGKILAVGAGGEGATGSQASDFPGGGAGGSGGLVALEAGDHILMGTNGSILAHGGSGGAGADGTNGGGPGADGAFSGAPGGIPGPVSDPSSHGGPGGGGSGGLNGNGGGDGYAGGSIQGGGGGGGGGAGVIRIHAQNGATLNNSKIAPNPT